MKQKYISKSVEETKLLGHSLAQELRGGDILLLSGNLGAGKTSFLQGLAQGLGVIDKVNSPTFNILKLYKIKNNGNIKQFCHIDAYRLESGDDLKNLAIDEIFSDKTTVTAIEWAEKVESVFPVKYIKIEISAINEDERMIITTIK